MGTSLGGRVALVEQADKESYEGASEIFTFRGYRGGIPALVLVRLQNGVMRSFVAEDMDDMSNSDDDNDFQDPPGTTAAAATRRTFAAALLRWSAVASTPTQYPHSHVRGGGSPAALLRWSAVAGTHTCTGTRNLHLHVHLHLPLHLYLY